MAGEAFGLGKARADGFPVAEIKAELANLGVSVSPHAKLQYLRRPKDGEHHPLVVLERIADEGKPDYCIEGFCHCMNCHEYCYLGTETSKVVVSAEAIPICRQCANEMIPQDGKPVKRLIDRAHGDHGHD